MSAGPGTGASGRSAAMGGGQDAGSPGAAGRDAGLPGAASRDARAPGAAGQDGRSPATSGQNAGLPGAASRAVGSPIAGRLLGRLSVLPALVAMAWLLAGLPLLLAGRFTPVPMLVISVPLAAALVYLGLRWTPGRWAGALPVAGPGPARTPWWAAAGVVAVAAAFGAHQLIYHSQQIIVLRDPAYYL